MELESIFTTFRFVVVDSKTLCIRIRPIQSNPYSKNIHIHPYTNRLEDHPSISIRVLGVFVHIHPYPRVKWISSDIHGYPYPCQFLAQCDPNLPVANDTAERGVSLIQSFILRFTKDEEQRQYLLQVVEQHRKKQPGTAKPSLPGPGWRQ